MSELDKVMEEFRLAVEQAETTEEQDKISSDFEERIDAAFKSDEDSIEEQIKRDQENIDKEKKADAESLKELEESLNSKIELREDILNKLSEDSENTELFTNMTYDVINLDKDSYAKKYKVKEMKSLCEFYELKKSGKEKDLIDKIYNFVYGL